MSAGTLRDFFSMQSKTGLTLDRKAQIFANIQGQIKPTTRQATSFSMVRSSWYFKTATTAALAFTLIYILYTPITGPLFQIQDNLLIARQNNVAQAGYVGDILATEGEINIVRNGIPTQTNKLQWGDIVYLYNTSKADFTLRDGSHGVVEWPAQLTIIENADSGLILSVDHARYMQIDKSQNNDTSTTEEQLTIQTPTSRITTEQDDKVHLALVTTQDRQFIQNKWDSVTIESIVPDTASPVTQQLASSTIADVTDTVKVYNEVAMIYQELKTQSTSQTYDLTSSDFATDDVKLLLALNDAWVEQVTSTPITQIAHNNITATNISVSDNTATTQISTTTSPSDGSETSITPVDTAPDTLFTMTVSDDISDSDDASIEQLSRSNTAAVSSVLNTEDDVTTDNGSHTTTTNNIEQEPTVKENKSHTWIKNPLTNDQIHQIIKHEWKTCIDSSDLKQLQRSFDIVDTISLTDTIDSIRSRLYLTDYLASILNNLTLCAADTNENQN
jgi:hypothetical protein